MDDTILVINCGSSSLKLAVFNRQLERIAGGQAERLGNPQAFATLAPDQLRVELAANADHQQALSAMVDALRAKGYLKGNPTAIGHRVVHGGEQFREAVVIDESVLAAIKACADLAPLHNPVNLQGIEATTSLFADVPQVAVFDTAFHQTLSPKAFLYALPRRFYQDWGVRRYGFHGTSHRFMLSEAARLLERDKASTSIISAHLGNGCSITAIADGKSVDTSMGLTPLEGLVMGTRSGDVDPGLFDFLSQKELPAEEVHRVLNNESGLLGLSGHTNDMRTLIEWADEGHEPSQQALDVFCFRLARYIGAMMASLSRLDALVFTGGIGENSARVRAQTLQQLELLGFRLAPGDNDQHGASRAGRIDHTDSRFPILVIPTDEERVIAREAAARATAWAN